MAMLSAMVNTLACFYPKVQRSTEEDFDEEAAWLLSKTRTIAAYSYRRSLGLPFIYTDPRLSYAGDFLHMMFSQPFEEYIAARRDRQGPQPGADPARRPRAGLQHHHRADRRLQPGQPVRLVRRGDLLALGPGPRRRDGRRRGDARGDPPRRPDDRPGDRARPGTRRAASGSRASATGSTRTSTRGRRMLKRRGRRRCCDQLGVRDPLLDVALQLEERALKDPYFIDHRLFPNADFYNGILMRAIGIPRNMFTVIFAIGRMPGWIAHWKEQADDPSLPDRPPPPALHRPGRDRVRADRGAVRVILARRRLGGRGSSRSSCPGDPACPWKTIGVLMQRASAAGYALGYFESWNLESLQGVIDAAEQTRSPIILGFNGGFLSRADRLAPRAARAGTRRWAGRRPGRPRSPAG